MRRTLPWLIAAALWPSVLSAQVRITVTLFDIAGLRREVREAMKTETSRIFLAAGLELEWVDCEIAGKPVNLGECARPLGPGRLMLQLAPGVNKTHPKASGFASFQAGVFACLYPRRVNELAREANWEWGDLLGHAAAHELGHLLLRSPAHSSGGVMRARWETEDMRRLTHAALAFLPEQANAMQAPWRSLAANQ